MKNLFAGKAQRALLALFVMLAFIAAAPMLMYGAAGEDGIKVFIDGDDTAFDVAPQIVNSRILVPLRAIFEIMGASVDWDEDTQTVTAMTDDIMVILTIGDTSPTINGDVVLIDQPGIIVDSRTLAPLRFVAEAFGGSVEWEGETQTAYIKTNAQPIVTPTTIVDTPGTTLPSAGGRVSVVGEKIFTFTPVRTGMWVFTTSDNGDSDPYLTLLDAEVVEIEYDDDSARDFNARLSALLIEGKSYTLHAGFYQGAEQGSYTLTITAPIEMAASGGKARVEGETAYSFTPNRTGIWLFATSDNGGSDPYLVLYNTQWELIAEDDDSAGNFNAMLVVNLEAGETYVIEAGYYDNGGSDSGGSYTLTASAPPELPSDGGEIRVRSDSIYVFTPSKTGTWEFSTSSTGNNDPVVYIIEDNLEDVVGHDDDSGEGWDALLSVLLNAGELYVVYVEFINDNGSTTLHISYQTTLV